MPNGDHLAICPIRPEAKFVAVFRGIEYVELGFRIPSAVHSSVIRNQKRHYFYFTANKMEKAATFTLKMS